MEVLKRKIIIVGAGHVGSHAGYALLSQGLVEEIVYIDIDQKKAEAQALDLYDSTLYLRKGAIVRAGDYSDAKDAQLLIVAAGFLGPCPDVAEAFGVTTDARSNLAAQGYATNVAKVYACGDCRTGQSLVVKAMADGRNCAKTVDEALA